METAERQRSFVLGIMDEMECHSQPSDAVAAALRALVDQLNVDGMIFLDMNGIGEIAHCRRSEGCDLDAIGNWASSRVAKSHQEIVAASGDLAENVTGADERQFLAQQAIGAFLLVPRICGDAGSPLVAVFHGEAREWQTGEIELVIEVGRRICRYLAANREPIDDALVSANGEVHQVDGDLQANRELLQATLDSSMDMIQVFEAVRDAAGEIVDFRWLLNNHTSESRYGEVRGQSLLERNPGVIEEGIFQTFCDVVETGQGQQDERHYVHEQFDGWFLQSVVKLNDGVATTTKDITGWKLAQADVLRLQEEVVAAKLKESETALHERDAWLAAQNNAFRQAMNGADLATSLGVLVEAVARLTADGRRCAFYIADPRLEHLNHVIGMPSAYASAVEPFPISTDSFACGLAVATGKPVISSDVASDPLWTAWRNVALSHGVRGCWSFPIETAAGRIVGSLACYFPAPTHASQRDREFAEAVTQAAAIIISLHQENEDRVATQDRLRLMVAELQHRVRNILAVVRSVLNGSLQSRQSLPDFAEQFAGRLDALARTQVLVTENAPGCVSLERLIREQLQPGVAHSSAGISVEGQPVLLDSSHAELLGLAIHELVTNALKYGALCMAGARLEITWAIAPAASGDFWLELDWRERGVQVAEQGKARRGFGTELIEQALPFQLQALTSMTIAKDGMHCTIAMPLGARSKDRCD